ncbi:mechanosensitive ion channel family protein [Psychromarinibacter halotolerans]|uniref:Small-conductance mechanosensitive channel n=1 Tax=Psychromarinibacter halotolerans TaxID=1775175 RepID=A0ABV7GLK2_9RHOB|nr:mechanosensitive ion channel family protein [Psychromarinibacter halotolerans]MDF0596035.1 mechanosensitive ion channel family protein [Psychromarinibacter halotolerans]
MNLDSFLSLQISEGVTVGDVLTVDFLASVLGNVVSAVVILLLGFVIGGWAARRIRKLGERHEKLDGMLFNFLGSIARYAILGITVIFVLNRFGLETTSLVAALGAAGLAIGLALQGTLSNVAAGVMIILFRPIKVGDFVEIADEMGTVKDVSLNYTELASLSNTQVIIPNAQVWGNTIENYSVYPTRRAEWTFGVSYDADLKLTEKTILDTIMADPRAKSDPEPFIQVNNLGDSSVDFLVRVWVDAGDNFAFQTDMKRKVKEALDDAGIEIPYPYRTVVMAGGEAPADAQGSSAA